MTPFEVMDPYSGYGGGHRGYIDPTRGQHHGGAYGAPPLGYPPRREDMDDSSDDDLVRGMGGLSCGTTPLTLGYGCGTGMSRGRGLGHRQTQSVYPIRIPDGSIPPYLDHSEMYVFPMRDVRVKIRVDSHGLPGTTFAAVVPFKTTVEDLIAQLLPSTGRMRRRGMVEVENRDGHRRVLEGREKIEDVRRMFPSLNKLIVSDRSERGHGGRAIYRR